MGNNVINFNNHDLGPPSQNDLAQFPLPNILFQPTQIPFFPFNDPATFSYNHEIYAFGGVQKSKSSKWSYSNKFWKLCEEDSQFSWKEIFVQQPLAQIPSPRSDFGYTVGKDCLFIFGGINESGCLGDFYKFSFETEKWTLLTQYSLTSETSTTTIYPMKRKGCSITYAHLNDTIILFGGFSTHYLCDTWKYDFISNSWIRLFVESDSLPKKSVSGKPMYPKPRAHHVAFYSPTRNQVFIHGGSSSLDGSATDPKFRVLDFNQFISIMHKPVPILTNDFVIKTRRRSISFNRPDLSKIPNPRPSSGVFWSLIGDYGSGKPISHHSSIRFSWPFPIRAMPNFNLTQAIISSASSLALFSPTYDVDGDLIVSIGGEKVSQTAELSLFFLPPNYHSGLWRSINLKELTRGHVKKNSQLIHSRIGFTKYGGSYAVHIFDCVSPEYSSSNLKQGFTLSLANKIGRPHAHSTFSTVFGILDPSSTESGLKVGQSDSFDFPPTSSSSTQISADSSSSSTPADSSSSSTPTDSFTSATSMKSESIDVETTFENL